MYDGLIIMEIALLIEDERDYCGKALEAYDFSWGSKKNGLCKVSGFLQQYFNNSIEYLYFGNEFCEYCLPNIDQLERIAQLCEKEKLKLVLVTPSVTEFGIERVNLLLEFIRKDKLDVDIVINDLGVLNLVKQQFNDINTIAGRVLDKTSHDSRATYADFDNYYGTAGKKFAMTPGVLSKQAQFVYDKYGIDRFEFDLPKIGLHIPNNKKCSLYWPYSYLTTGRVCLFRSIELAGKDKFLVGNSSCNKLCQKYQIEKRKPLNGFITENGERIAEMYLFQRGNTIFYINDVETSNKYVDQFDRIVVQP